MERMKLAAPFQSGRVSTVIPTVMSALPAPQLGVARKAGSAALAARKFRRVIRCIVLSSFLNL
jgi:hypothetical protein